MYHLVKGDINLELFKEYKAVPVRLFNAYLYQDSEYFRTFARDCRLMYILIGLEDSDIVALKLQDTYVSEVTGNMTNLQLSLYLQNLSGELL